jgi:hypothetical protein
MNDKAAAAVARGAAWLDMVHPGWERKIDLARLELRDECRCVLGQLCTIGTEDEAQKNGTMGYKLVTDVVWDAWGAIDGSPRTWAVDNGFNIDYRPRIIHDAEFSALDEAWIALIKERFASGLLSDEAV